MTLAYWTVLIAAVLPIVCAGIAKSGRFGVPRREGGYDNHDPRSWLASQDGFRKRADNAQANSFEALPFFIGAVIIAHQLGVPQGVLNALAVSWIVLRVAYIALYVTDRPGPRSMVWTLAFAVNVAILAAGAWR